MHQPERRTATASTVTAIASTRDFRTGHLRHVIDNELDTLLDALPAILIDGPKGVGKTATTLKRATTVRRLDRPTDRQILGARDGGTVRSAV